MQALDKSNAIDHVVLVLVLVEPIDASSARRIEEVCSRA